MGQVIAYTQPVRALPPVQRIDVFDQDQSSNQLVMYYALDGTWYAPQSLGSPANTLLRSNCSATTYLPSDGRQRNQVFVVGQDNQLYVDYYDGAAWQWVPLRTPPGASLAGAPEATAYIDQTNTARTRAFVLGSDGNLWMNWWDGVHPVGNQWSNLHAPPGTIVDVSSPPQVAAYWGATTGYNIYVFLVGKNAHLYVNLWNGANWSGWEDLGTPPGPPTIDALCGSSAWSQAIPFKQFRADVFVRSHHSMYAKGGNDPSPTTWQWEHLNPAPNPPLGSLGRAGSGALFPPNGVFGINPRINVFVAGEDVHLHLTYWDGSRWQWEDHGQPQRAGTPAPVVSIAGVTAYLKRAFGDILSTIICAVVYDPESGLYARYFDGAAWHWQTL